MPITRLEWEGKCLSQNIPFLVPVTLKPPSHHHNLYIYIIIIIYTLITYTHIYMWCDIYACIMTVRLHYLYKGVCEKLLG